jgi:membrane protease YdiL (CAAX protease family)
MDTPSPNHTAATPETSERLSPLRNPHFHGEIAYDAGSGIESRVVALGLAFAFVFLAILLWTAAGWALAPALADHHPLLKSVSSLMLGVLPATYLLLRLMGDGRWAAVGLPLNRAGVQHVAAGIGLGGGLAAFIVGVQWSAGWLALTRGTLLDDPGEWLWEPQLLLGVTVLAVGAAGEELLFRGYGLQHLMRAATPWPAVIGTSALFGLLHFNNPDFSRIGMLNTMLFGGLFGVALVRHRSLWLAYGMHFGWNLTLALAGVNVSGLTIRLTDLSFAPAGPSLWSGAEYGPEGSLLTTFAVAGLGMGLWKIRLAADPSPKLWETKPVASLGGGQS